MGEAEDLLTERIAAALRTPESLDPSFDARVMAAVRAGDVPERAGTPVQWLFRPRIVRLSPLAGLAFAASIAAITIVGTSLVRGTTESASIAALTASPTAQSASLSAPGSAPQVVQFVLVAPQASRVALVGDFNDWNPAATPLVRATSTVWVVDIPLSSGRYTYAFMVDGTQWVADPAAPPAAGENFGHPNSVLTVGGTTS